MSENVFTICPYCGCGCGLYLRREGEQITGVLPSRRHPVSRGNLCVKGWQLPEIISHPERLTSPLMRQNGRLVPVSWDEALDFCAAELGRVGAGHGPSALGVLASAKCTSEENYLLQKFTRAVLKTNNIDHCARL
ncbi:molybdopterin oxidoreductase [Desulfurivibrio alkaliphilus AHT 2]|uniref:Molybdopterin oxidoreductase n=1 Tax=Desulfurivibrio alkaliphilus (strain DSM 19089 / UNIQEM U267 / AHT2) TaxID=589865 RepID=D6Z5F2_DESAT|nr:molybdopterin oxidoreductase [Desulfurivibrio alkaliphilus AHT 2]